MLGNRSKYDVNVQMKTVCTGMSGFGIPSGTTWLPTKIEIKE